MHAHSCAAVTPLYCLAAGAEAVRKQDKYRDERRAVLVRVSPLRWSRLFCQLAKYRETAETAINLMKKKGKKQRRKELDAKAILEEVRLLVCRSVVCHTHTHTRTHHTHAHPMESHPPMATHLLWLLNPMASHACQLLFCLLVCLFMSGGRPQDWAPCEVERAERQGVGEAQEKCLVLVAFRGEVRATGRMRS
jgi:hypothetical protein